MSSKMDLANIQKLIAKFLMKQNKMSAAEAQENAECGTIEEIEMSGDSDAQLFTHTYPWCAGLMRRDVYKMGSKGLKCIASLEKNLVTDEKEWSEFQG